MPRKLGELVGSKEDERDHENNKELGKADTHGIPCTKVSCWAIMTAGGLGCNIAPLTGHDSSKSIHYLGGIPDLFGGYRSPRNQSPVVILLVRQPSRGYQI